MTLDKPLGLALALLLAPFGTACTTNRDNHDGGPINALTVSSPPVGRAGAVIRIEGTGFAPAAGDNLVLFNGIPVVPHAIEGTNALLVEVPADVAAAAQPVRVEVRSGDEVALTTLQGAR